MLHDTFKRFNNSVKLKRIEGCGVVEEILPGQIALINFQLCINCENSNVCELYRRQRLRAKIIIEMPPNLPIGFNNEGVTIKLQE